MPTKIAWNKLFDLAGTALMVALIILIFPTWFTDLGKKAAVHFLMAGVDFLLAIALFGMLRTNQERIEMSRRRWAYLTVFFWLTVGVVDFWWATKLIAK